MKKNNFFKLILHFFSLLPLTSWLLRKKRQILLLTVLSELISKHLLLEIIAVKQLLPTLTDHFREIYKKQEMNKRTLNIKFIKIYIFALKKQQKNKKKTTKTKQK